MPAGTVEPRLNVTAAQAREHGASLFVQGKGLSPQQWWEVLAPPADLAERCGALFPHDDLLSVDELATVVRAIHQDESMWRPLVVTDPERRRYRLLYEDDRVDIWVLSWMPGQGTGFHDHGVSGVALCSCEGTVVERQMVLPQGSSTVHMTPGTVRTGPAGYIHSVAFSEAPAPGVPTVTLHAYSPPLLEVGQYRADDDGVLWREIVHGRQELVDHSIGDIDPSRADRP